MIVCVHKCKATLHKYKQFIPYQKTILNERCSLHTQLPAQPWCEVAVEFVSLGRGISLPCCISVFFCIIHRTYYKSNSPRYSTNAPIVDKPKEIHQLQVLNVMEHQKCSSRSNKNKNTHNTPGPTNSEGRETERRNIYIGFTRIFTKFVGF